jgi:hypothetical protein
MMLVALGELIIFLGLVGLSSPGGSHCYPESTVSQDHDSSPVRKWVYPQCFTDLNG